MYKLEFTRPEMEEIRKKIYLTDLQKKILDLKLEGNDKIIGIADKCGVCEKTVSNHWKEIIEKIYKVI